MTIDTERLKTDAAYWDEVAPEGATHYSEYYGAFVMPYAPGKWLVQSERGGKVVTFMDVGIFIPRPTTPAAPEWDGEGLPPVGVECEYTKPDGYAGRERVWFWCRVVAHDNGGAVIVTERGHYHLRKAPEYEFRPLRSISQKQRDDLAGLCDSYIKADDYGRNLADAILSRYNLEPKL